MIESIMDPEEAIHLMPIRSIPNGGRFREPINGLQDLANSVTGAPTMESLFEDRP